MDSNTDMVIQQVLRDSFDKCTILTIAHRISTIIDYDMIVVMDQGRVVETGTPVELLARKESKFRRLAMENGAIVENIGNRDRRNLSLGMIPCNNCSGKVFDLHDRSTREWGGGGAHRNLCLL